MIFCAQKKLEKAKEVMYTALQQPGIALSTGSNRVCLANAILEWPLKPIEAQRCVKRLGSSGEGCNSNKANPDVKSSACEAAWQLR
jgi:hypothetical protein